MISKLSLIALPVMLPIMLLIGACAPVPPPAPAPAPPPPMLAAPPPPPPAPAASTAPIPIRTLSCGEMVGAEDDDRAAAGMFFIGYQAAASGVHNLTISQIQEIEDAALKTCAAHPQMAAVRAFHQAMLTRPR
jgi:hypothetical protein